MGLFNNTFNSIMVQLEHFGKDLAKVVTTFQFHYGSIRTMVPNQKPKDQDSFNSIMVQLEHNSYNHYTTCNYFQFHYGSIRTCK